MTKKKTTKPKTETRVALQHEVKLGSQTVWLDKSALRNPVLPDTTF